MNEKAEIRKLIEAARGDDLWRAERSFHGASDAQMNQQYGQSNRTCQEVLDAYKRHEDRIDKLIAWLDGEL